jgi:hypothetical protein
MIPAVSDARIRLEGKLEEIERTTAMLDTALTSARNGQWATVLLAFDDTARPQVSTAVEAAQKLVKVDRELVAPLRQFERARTRLDAFVQERARKRGMQSDSLRKLVEMLRDEDLRFDEYVRSLWAVLWMVQLGLLTVAGIVFAPPILFLALFATFFTLPGLLGKRVVVTGRTLTIGKTVVPITDIVRVRFSLSPRPGSFSRCVAVIETRGGTVEARLPRVPIEAVDALKSLRIEVERRDQWWPDRPK